MSPVNSRPALLPFLILLIGLVWAHPPAASDHLGKQDDLVYQDLPGYGQLIGKLEQTFSGKPVHAFRGIPYSRAKRYERYADPAPWSEPLDATAFGPTCHDQDYEDVDTSARCLLVNVYTSNLDTGNLAPVLVYIHGGGFLWGDGYSEDLTYFLEDGMVAVTLNYRLGALGFLHSPDASVGISGNFGLKDQIEALKWVQRNIAVFGGNPNDVTIMGVSAGAASVDYLTLIPHETEGLFKGAITISGAATCPWAIQKDPEETFNKYARIVGCLSDGQQPNQDTYNCLMSKDFGTLMWLWSSEFQSWAGLPFTFVPSVDGELLRDTPENILASGSFVQVPVLAGINKDEGFLVSAESLKSLESMATLRQNWQSYCPLTLEMGNLSPSDANQACTRSSEYYMNSEPIDYQTYYEFIKMAGTRLFDLPQQRSAMGHSAYAPYYGYRHEYQGARGQWAFYYNDVPEEVPRLASGVPHVGEWASLFANQQYPIIPGEQDEWVHKFFMGAYLNFIKTGVPTIPEDLNYDLEWPRFTPENPRIQVIDKFPRISTRYTPKDEEDFWVSVGL